ncbi:MAG: hypothetical protein HUU02_04035 [Bacteroidetes bacterium]|nr:hypothetical protein [Bacteroidota bacterium]
MKKIVILIFVLSCVGLADEVYLKTGYVIKNVTVKDTVNNFVVLSSRDGDKRIVLSQILKIVLSNVDINSGPSMEVFEEKMVQRSFAQTNEKNEPILVTYERPRIGMASISIIAALLAYDNFDQSSNLQTEIDRMNSLNTGSGISVSFDTSHYESEKSKRIALGVAYSIVAIVNLVYSLEKVEVKASSNSIGMAYHF